MKELLQEAQQRLAGLKSMYDQLDARRLVAERAIAAAAKPYEAEIARLKTRIQDSEKYLLKFQKKHKKTLFADADRLDLPAGALLYQVKMRVRRIQGMLKRLKAAGFYEAVKTAESVDWDKIEKWGADKLDKVGTKREKRESFAYELTGRKND